MEIPTRLIIDSITEPCIFYFKDTTHHKDAPAHYYFVIPVNAASSVLISIFTSQLDKRINYYQRRENAIESLIHVDGKIFSFLDRHHKSLIDCNKTEMLTKQELFRRVDNSVDNKRISGKTISEEFFKKVVTAIIASPVVKRNIKQALLGRQQI